MGRLQIWATAAAIAALALIVLGWLVLSPSWALRAVKFAVSTELGRTFEASGSVHLEFSPRLAIRLDGVSLSNPADSDSAFVTAQSLRVAVGIGQLLSHQLDLSQITLDQAALAFTINEKGEASWDFPSPKTPAALHIDIENGALRYFDARNGQSFVMGGATLSADLSADGELSLRGTAAIKGRLARIEAYVKSWPRIHQDGAPFELSFDAPDLAVTFNGQLAAAKVLGLAGALSLSSKDAMAAARWAGIAVAASGNGPLSLSGGLEAQGRAFAVHQANLTWNAMTAQGDIALDFRSDVAKLQASLQLPALNLDRLIPASGAKPGEWGTVPLGFAGMKSIDAELTLAAKAFAYGGITSGPATLNATLAQGRLDATLDLDAIAGGRARLGLAVDGAALPPGIAIGLKTEGSDAARLLPALMGVTWLSGQGSMSASLSGSGQTQQEIIGSLRGSADLALSDGAILGAPSQRIFKGVKTDYATLSAKVTISDGIASVTLLHLDSPQLAMSGTGDIDLLRRALDFKVEPRLKTAAEGLAPAMTITGPWESPRISTPGN